MRGHSPLLSFLHIARASSLIIKSKQNEEASAFGPDSDSCHTGKDVDVRREQKVTFIPLRVWTGHVEDFLCLTLKIVSS